MAQTNYHPRYGHYLTVWEADGNVQVCLKTEGMITDPLYVDIETTEQHENTTRYTLATGKFNASGRSGLMAWCVVLKLKCSDLGMYPEFGL